MNAEIVDMVEEVDTEVEEVNLRQQLLDQQQKRAAVCENEIMGVLKKHNCTLQAVQVFIDGQPRQLSIRVVAVD